MRKKKSEHFFLQRAIIHRPEIEENELHTLIVV